MPPLTPTEKRILALLVEGHTYKGISKSLNISQASLHMHTHNIREKTGIRSTRDRAAVVAYWETVHEPCPNDLTPTERRVMELFAEYKTYPEICAALGVSHGTVMNLVSLSCKKLQVKAYGLEKRDAVRAIFGKANAPANPMDDPMF